MASAAIDCRPLRDTNSVQAALASVHIATDPVSSPTAAGQPRTPGGSRKVAYQGQLYAAEVVGRKVAVLHIRNGMKAWDKATITEFSAAAGQHKIKYSNNKQEDWHNLCDLKFKWTQVLPPTAPANPTHKPELSREAAVGKRLRVYWPAMQKWYYGIVKSYDPHSDRHTISYRDGDTQAVVLRHEPIVWSDDDPAVNGTSSGDLLPAASPRHSNSAGSTPKCRPVNAFAVPLPPLAVAERPALRARSPAVRGRSPPGRDAALSALAAAFAGVACKAARQQQQQRAGSLSGKAGKPATAVTTPMNRAANGPVKAGSSAGVAATAAGRPAVAGGSASGPSRAPAAAGADRMARTTADQLPKTAGISNGTLHTHKAGGGKVPASNGHPTAVASTVDMALLKQRRHSDPGGGRGGLAAIADKHLAVGCRVSVYWRLDKLFYRGKLTSYSPSSGKYTIKYDDGQSEAVLLEKERFVWQSPRGCSAGYRPAVHRLMQQLGAELLQALPEQSADGKIVPAAPGPEDAPHPPVSGAGAVGWRIKLYWAADAAWHEAEVLSYDEGRHRHHLLYLDGEEEWTDLARENVRWLKATRHGAISAGRVAGDEVPKGRDAIGWRIAVYWKDDRMFYEGEVCDYEASTGRHKVSYSDGEEEWLRLGSERVIWRLPPAEESSEEDDSDPGTTDVSDVEMTPSEDDEKEEGLEQDHEGGQRGGSRKRPQAARIQLKAIRTRKGGAAPAAGAERHPLHPLHLQVRGNSRSGSGAAGLRVGQAGRGPGGSGVAGSAGSKGGAMQRQGLAGGGAAGGARMGAAGCHLMGGGSGTLSLPPLIVRRSSADGGAAGGGSPVRQVQSAEQLKLLVKIVPGDARAAILAVGGAGSAAPDALGGPAFGGAAAAAGPSSVIGVSMTDRAGCGLATAALQPLLQKLPVRQQRAAARLQRKMDRLHLILGKLASTAGTMGWKLDQAQLPVASSTLLAAAAAAAAQPYSANDKPMSPTAGRRRLGSNPTSPMAVMSPRAVKAMRAAGTSSTAGGSLPVSPRGPVSPGPCSPTAAAAGRPVPVVKTCAVKSKPGQGNSNGQRLRMLSPGSTPTIASSSSTGCLLAGAAAAGGSGNMQLGVPKSREDSPAAALLEANNPAAPSASLTADDVVLKLQAMAAAQGSSALQQHLQSQQIRAAALPAASPAAANGNHLSVQVDVTQASPGPGTAS
eukprot:gene3944-4198_t